MPDAIADEIALPGVAVQSVNDGQRGVIVEHDGRLAVRLDRGTGVTNQTILVPFHRNRWSAAEEPRLQSGQLGRVTYEADRALLIARGEYGAPEWQTLREGERINWTAVGPPESDPQRRRLFQAITRALAPGRA